MANQFTRTSFWSKIQVGSWEECWNHTVGEVVTRGHGGYGRIRYYGKRWLIHRLMYTLAFGDVPQGLDVLHSCDNPRCCNPAHLWLGTDKDNAQDKSRKGRCRGRDKLTREQREEIKKRYIPWKVSQSFLANEYGVSKGAITALLSGRSWKGR